MYFTVVDSAEFVENSERLEEALRQESVDTDQYVVRIHSEAESARTALEDVSGELSVPGVGSWQEGRSRALTLHQCSPPVTFGVQLRGAGDVLDTFVSIGRAVDHGTDAGYRVRVRAEGCGSSPVYALQDVRETGLVTEFQVRNGDGFETLVREVGGEVFVYPDNRAFRHSQRGKIGDTVVQAI